MIKSPLIIIAALALVLSACTKKSDSSVDKMIEPGESAPDFSFQDVNNKTFKLADYKNKVVVLFFFGNTCPSCIGVAPNLEKELNAAYAGRNDYAILGLDHWDGEASSISAFQSTTGVSFPLLLKASSTADTYKVVYDRIVVIDKNGFIRFKGTQVAANDLVKAKSVVDAYLAK
ncbi:MAG: TlpA disulfide reductase family protein [Bacteroidetes bacterium]|nr:TlpA disulfide reductase family protein [Bacteroidota bacterium]